MMIVRTIFAGTWIRNRGLSAYKQRNKVCWLKDHAPNPSYDFGPPKDFAVEKPRSLWRRIVDFLMRKLFSREYR